MKYFTLEDFIDSRTKEAKVFKKENDKIRCYACAHKCLIPEGKRGICKVRFVKQGRLWSPYGYVAGLANDPIEKKPFYHFLPGTRALTFGMLGCNFHCPFCQNWFSSQVLKDKKAHSYAEDITPEEIVSLALKYNSRSVVSSYNEPLITCEWAKDIFKIAKKYNLKTAFVSDGYVTEEVIDFLGDFIDAYKIDLKSFREKNYRILGAQLKKVLDGIKIVFKRRLWLEIVTLIVPGLNDDEEEIRDIAKFISSLSKDIPWHVTAFHPDYKMTDRERTPLKKLVRAREIGMEEGIRFVYCGNIWLTPELESTYCYKCNSLLIKREGFRVIENNIKNGKCPKCLTDIPGIWE